MVARKVGPSTMTLSPGPISVLPSRSSACWLPVVTISWSGVTSLAPFWAMNCASCSRSELKPSVAPYCKAAPGSWAKAALLASRMPSTSNIALSGKPPAKLMMPGLPRSLNSSRMAEVSTLLRRSAKGMAMGHNLGMKKAFIEPFFATLKAANPQPNTELEYTSVFELLSAVLLSAQATDVGVNKATRRLFPVANTPKKILALGLDGLEAHIKTIGLYRSKARHLMQTCRILVEQHGGRVPRERASLEALPGVGRKTANVVLNVAFGEPTMAVDTHIFRVSNRTGLAPGKTPNEEEMQLLKRVPTAYLVDAHHWLILHGRYICQARKPLCGQCAVSRYCDFKPKTP